MAVYTIVTMEGDYPPENQKCWHMKFNTLDMAIRYATDQHNEMDLHEHHTMILNNDAETFETEVVWLIYQDQSYTGDEAQDVADFLEHLSDNKSEVMFEYLEQIKQIKLFNALILQIQDALGTAEVGDGLVEVARNAHIAERAFRQIQLDDYLNKS